MLHRLVVAFHLLLVVLLLNSCDREETVTKEDAALFAQKISRTINNHDPSVLNDAIDADALVKRTSKDLNSPNSRGLREGVVSGLKRIQFGSQLVKAIAKSGFYHLVKQYEKDGKRHLLFCLYGDEGINYHDFELVKKHGVVKAADVYIYLMGQSISEILVQTLSTLNSDNVNMKGLDPNKMMAMRQLIAQKKYTEATAIFNELPAELKQVRAFRRIDIELLSGIDDQPAYKAAVDSYVHDFPNSPDVFLLEIDRCLTKNDYDGTLVAVNKLDNALASDPFLDFYRGVIYKLKQNSDSTKYYFERVMKNYPEFSDCYIEMIVQYHEDKNTVAAKRVLSAYKAHPNFDKKVLTPLTILYPELKED